MGQARSEYVHVDGAAVAYQLIGDGDRTVVLTPGSFNNVDAWWDDPTAARFLRRIGSFARLILFDRRGTGASDPMPGGILPTWKDWVADFDAVLDATQVGPVSVIAQLDGVHLALLYTATHPGRVNSLVLFNSSARMRAAPDYVAGLPDAEVDARIAWLAENWGTEAMSLRNYPSRGDDPEFLRWYARYQRASIPKGMIRDFVSQWWESDSRHLLDRVDVPTLVLHRGQYDFVPSSQGRWLADHLPDATFVELDGGGSLIAYGADENADYIEQFVTGASARAIQDRTTVAVLFSDIVGSTEQLVARGDTEWRALLDAHDEIARRSTRQHAGWVVESTGDGFLATFPSAGQAVEAARTFAAAVADLGLEVRAAVHWGEVEVRDGGQIGGLTVHIAARLLSVAAEGTIAMSAETAAALDEPAMALGEVTLKGVPGRWNVHTVAQFTG